MEKSMNRIRELREKMGLSAAKLGEIVGVSDQYIYDLEKGKCRLNETLILRLCQVFNVTSDYLLGIDLQHKSEEANKQVVPGGPKFAKLSPESRKIVLQLIDHLYQIEQWKRILSGDEKQHPQP
ncbi:MAG: helix-turn-helix transcriptional regulator [Anaerolineae bacterium]